VWRDARDAVADMLSACTEITAFTKDVDIASLGREELPLLVDGLRSLVAAEGWTDVAPPNAGG
jgi:uncharacterized protein with HEPN domain